MPREVDPSQITVPDDVPAGREVDPSQITLIQHGPTSANTQPTPSKSLGGFAHNLVNSTGNFIGDVGNVVLHPYDTALGVKNLAQGLYEKTIPFQTGPHEKYVDAVANQYRQRYGGIQNTLDTLYNDPVGSAADATALATGVGEMGRAVQLGSKAAKLARIAEISSNIAKGADAVADATNPLNAVGKVVNNPITRKLASKLPERMYQSALKPPPSIDMDEVGRIVNTGLQNKVPISASGADKLQSLISDLDAKTKAKIAAASNQGITIDPNAVAQRIQNVSDKFAKQVNPADDLGVIERSKQEFLTSQGQKPGTSPQAGGLLNQYGQPIMTGGTSPTPAQPMSAMNAQELKQGTYQQLKDRSYGELKNAQIESEKALARGLKEELSSAIPEIGPLNAQNSALRELQPALERAVNRINNHNLFSMDGAVAGGATAAASHSLLAGAGAWAMKLVLGDPAVKSQLAIAIANGSGFPTWMGRGARIAMATARLNNYINSLSPAPVTPSATPASTNGPHEVDPSQIQFLPSTPSPGGASMSTPASTNNNPGNLKDPQTGAWQKFSSPQEGFSALINDIQSKQTGNTRTGLGPDSSIAQLIKVYAPAKDNNNPVQYAKAIAAKLGVPVTTPIARIPTRALASVIANYEDPEFWAQIQPQINGKSPGGGT